MKKAVCTLNQIKHDLLYLQELNNLPFQFGALCRWELLSLRFQLGGLKMWRQHCQGWHLENWMILMIVNIGWAYSPTGALWPQLRLYFILRSISQSRSQWLSFHLRNLVPGLITHLHIFQSEPLMWRNWALTASGYTAISGAKSRLWENPSNNKDSAGSTNPQES